MECADTNMFRLLWCRQDSFVQSYLTTQRSAVFTSVAVLCFVFDIASKEAAADIISFASTIAALHEFSPSAKLFILIHKMDLVPLDQKTALFQSKSKEVRKTCEVEGFVPEQVEFCATSMSADEWNPRRCPRPWLTPPLVAFRYLGPEFV